MPGEPIPGPAAARDRFLADVLAGLGRPRKSLPCKYFYDRRGAELFERICELEEYYPTRTELGIMERSAGDMAACLGPGCLVIEYGTGAGLKTRILLEALDEPVAYVPIDISCDQLASVARVLDARHPDLEVLPVCADYTAHYRVPPTRRPARRRVVYFPGSTVGNFDHAEARDFLEHVRDVCGKGGALLVGVDLKKDPARLERAYDDAQGVTAAFNLNLLARINRELGADFDLDRFRHRALYRREPGRIEMHLESVGEQTVRVGGCTFHFAAGETIHTESSYKYHLEEFAALAASGGLQVERVWTDDQRLFSVQYLRAV